jgi:hypothetical protein
VYGYVENGWQFRGHDRRTNGDVVILSSLSFSLHYMTLCQFCFKRNTAGEVGRGTMRRKKPYIIPARHATSLFLAAVKKKITFLVIVTRGAPY